MLIGDLVMAVREAVTDLPPTLNAPAIISLTAYHDTNGSVLQTLTYYIYITQLNPWGESLPSNEMSVIVNAPNNAIAISFTGNSGAQNPDTTNNYRVYIGYASGQENSWFPFSVVGGSFNLLQAIGGMGGPGPQRSSAYFPDADGEAISAYTMFRWINDALKLASQVCGGLLDYSGVGTVVGAPQYIAPGLWKRISSMWYDGYPLAMDDTGNYFRRNAITASVLSSAAGATFNNQMMIELWPQPARSAALTTLANDLLVGQLTATVVNSSGFLLTNGFAKIGTEIVSYSGLQGNVLSNLQRALSGTTAVLQPAGSIVQELNLFWNGWREYNPNFQPGSSMQVVPVPLGWETNLFEYGLARMKLAEQNVGDYSKLNDSFKKQMSDWYRSNKVTLGPRQIGDQTSGLETLPNLGGGWVVPALFPIVYVNEKCYDALLGGASWHLFSFIACATLELVMFVMLGKRIIPRNERLRITLNRCWNTVGQKLNGFWNSVLSDSDRNFMSSKSVTKVIGPNVSGFGFSTTVGYGNFLTPDWAEKLFLHEQKKVIESWVTKSVESPALLLWGKRYPLLSKAISFLRKLAPNSGRQMQSSTPTRSEENVTERQLRIGGPTLLQKNAQRAWKEMKKLVGIGGKR